jgi:general secretion pathway protein F
MRFELRAITQEGRIESLDLQALDEASAREHAESQGYTVVAVRKRMNLRGALRGAGERFPIVLFSQELLVLLAAGLPLVEAIDTLATKERRDDFRALLSRIVVVLRQGRTFSSALEQFPTAFSALYVATVRAAERTSDLPHALGRFVAYQNQIDLLRKRVVNASIYPLVLIGMGTLVSLFLLFYVVPRFGRIYEDRAADLPFVSQLLLSWGQLVEGHGMTALTIFAVVAAAIVYAVRATGVRAAIGDAVWRIPGIGERMKVYQLARFYRTIGMLLKGGMPLVAALKIGAELLHPVLRERLSAAARSISEGQSVSESLDANGLTTPVALRMLIVGEQSGNMGEMMDRIATFHDEEISRWVDWFTRLFEPILMAAIGLLIGGIVILMYMPIFELAGSLQ